MSERLVIRIDGVPMEVPADVSLAAALFNAGQLTFRSSVSGSPRGPLCGMGTCFECRVTIGGVPHRRACLEPVVDGMEVSTGG